MTTTTRDVQAAAAIIRVVHQLTGLLPEPGEGPTQLVARATGLNPPDVQRFQALIKQGSGRLIEAEKTVRGGKPVPAGCIGLVDLWLHLGAAAKRLWA